MDRILLSDNRKSLPADHSVEVSDLKGVVIRTFNLKRLVPFLIDHCIGQGSAFIERLFGREGSFRSLRFKQHPSALLEGNVERNGQPPIDLQQSRRGQIGPFDRMKRRHRINHCRFFLGEIPREVDKITSQIINGSAAQGSRLTNILFPPRQIEGKRRQEMTNLSDPARLNDIPHLPDQWIMNVGKSLH